MSGTIQRTSFSTPIKEAADLLEKTHLLLSTKYEEITKTLKDFDAFYGQIAKNELKSNDEITKVLNPALLTYQTFLKLLSDTENSILPVQKTIDSLQIPQFAPGTREFFTTLLNRKEDIDSCFNTLPQIQQGLTALQGRVTLIHKVCSGELAKLAELLGKVSYQVLYADGKLWRLSSYDSALNQAITDLEKKGPEDGSLKEKVEDKPLASSSSSSTSSNKAKLDEELKNKGDSSAKSKSRSGKISSSSSSKNSEPASSKTIVERKKESTLLKEQLERIHKMVDATAPKQENTESKAG